MAVIVGVSEDLTAPAALYLEAVAVSVLVFWSTHVYAEALIGRLRDPQGGWRRLARESAKHEMPLLEAAAPPAFAWPWASSARCLDTSPWVWPSASGWPSCSVGGSPWAGGSGRTGRGP